jgi:PAS domain S-box-containing protein
MAHPGNPKSVNELSERPDAERAGVPAAEHARVLAETEERLRETATLLAVGRIFASTASIPEAMRRVTRVLARAFEADMGGAYFLDPAKEALVPLAGYHVPTHLVPTLLQTPFPIARFAFLREGCETGKPVWTSDYATDARFDQDFLAPSRPRTLLFVPTAVRSEVVGGLFLVWWSRARAFTPSELHLLEGIASQVGLALENADLIRQTQDKLRETEVLAELARTVNSTLDLDVVLERIVDGARELCGSDMAAAALREPGSGAMRMKRRAGYRYDGYEALRIEPGRGLGGAVLTAGTPLRTENYVDDPRFSKDYIEAIRADGTITSMAVPVWIGGTVEGLLYVSNRSPRAFSDRDEAVLQRLAEHAAIAIRNARLYDESERRRLTAEALAGVSRALAQELDPDRVSQRIADSVRALLASRIATVFWLEPSSAGLVTRAVSGDGDVSAWRDTVLPRGIGAAALAVGELGVVALPDMLADPRVVLLPDMRTRIEGEGNHAVLAVPLSVKGRTIGALSVRDRTGRVFDDDEIRLAQAFADRAALSLENARLYAEAEAAVQALRTSEAQYRALVQGSIQGMYIHADRVIRLVNASMVRMFGYDRPEELVGQDYLILITPDDRARIEGYRAARLRGAPAPTRYEARGITKDGRPIWIEILVSLIPWDGATAVLGTFIDITERKRVEAAERDAIALRSVTQLANAAAHEINNPLAVVVGNLHMLGMELNRTAPVQTRVAKARQAADRIRDIVSRMAHITRIKTADASPQLPARLDLLESSQERQAPHARSPLPSSTTEAAPPAATEDLRARIAELERLEAARRRDERESRERHAVLERAQAVAHVGHWTTELADDDRLVWSRETYRIFGLDEDSFDGRLDTFFSRVHPDDLEAVRRARQSALAGQAPYGIDHRIVRPDGTVRWVHEEAEIIRDAGARPVRILGVVQDITERKQTEQLRAELEDQLRQVHKMGAVGALAGGIAHDFNNLLTVIAGRVKLLGTRCRNHPDLSRELAIVERTADRATELTRQLLAFSRKQILQPKVVDLNEIVASSVEMLHSVIGEHIHLTSIPDAHLGRVRVDPGQIEQVIMNLAVNARDAMPSGGRLIFETANVELDDSFVAQHPGTPPGSYVRLAVTDTGIGMDRDIREHIFEPFFTTKDVGQGTGLGLSTVYAIVRQHAGAITVESAPGRGTTFTIFLPRVEDATDPAAPLGIPAPVVRGAETILLVEDEQGVRELVQEILEGSGYRVLEARHPGEALLIGERYPGPIDLLLTDFAMPQMDGLELAERIRVLRPSVRVLYVSAYANGLPNRDIRHRLAPLLEKPFMPDALVRCVREVLDTTPAS